MIIAMILPLIEIYINTIILKVNSFLNVEALLVTSFQHFFKEAPLKNLITTMIVKECFLRIT